MRKTHQVPCISDQRTPKLDEPTTLRSVHLQKEGSLLSWVLGGLGFQLAPLSLNLLLVPFMPS